MNKPYLIFINNVLYTRKLTRLAAKALIQDLTDKGINATLAYQPDNLKENEL